MSLLVFVLAGLACCWALGTTEMHSKVPGAPARGGKSAVRRFGIATEGVDPGAVASVPLLLDLLGTSLDAGLTVQGALRVVAAVAEQQVQGCLLRVVAGLEIGASWNNAWEGNLAHPDVVGIHEALSFAALTGASAAPLLYAQARQGRTAAGRAAERRAATLGVKLVLPLGLCALPAFIALGIVPVVLAMVPAF
ncbi:type II secretion system F family protein [Specibacter sp. NPDC057265]|uniref:type II secretion system F family protein n=1 Tax=Specibacter sp. NPDC057265 TaxID=3346075 RepID=UPI0036368C89